MKIAVFEVEEWELPAFDEIKKDHEVVTVHEPLSPGNAGEYADADIVSTFIYSELRKGTLEKLKALKMIATRSTGFDHIDLGYCRERGVTVSNVPHYGETTVAEHVFGLLLTISHRLAEAIDRTRKGDFSQTGLRGFDLLGKTLGVVGTGGIGRHVIDIANGFSMEVIAFDVAPDKKFAEERGFKYMGLDDVIANADIITLHVPANEKTHHMISQQHFWEMKKGVVIINTSRGSVIDVQALLRAIADGTVSAVGLDVLEEEPAIREEAELLSSIFRKKYNLESVLANSILLRLRNVVITPHSAFNTKEAVERILQTSVHNIDSFIAGTPSNMVEGPAKYAKAG